jgi:hypothetical protein
MQEELVRDALIKIAEDNHGYLKPEKIVAAAEDPNSPLHDQFQWDDTEAARHYRNIQAGVLIRMIKITVVRKSVDAKVIDVSTTRGFQSLPSDRTADSELGSYQATETIMAAPEKREEILQTVLRELAAYRKRYAEIAELVEVWAALDVVMQ